MIIEGNKNKISNTTHNITTINHWDKKRGKKRIVTFWSFLIGLLTLLGWYFDYHKQLGELLGIHEENPRNKSKNIHFERSIKPEEREKTGKYKVQE